MNWGISLMNWGISLLYWVLVLSFGENFKITGHPDATMAACIVLCLGY